MNDDPSPAAPVRSAATGRRWGRWLLLGLLVAMVAGITYAYGDRLTLEELAQQEERLRAWRRQHPGWFYAAAFLFYVVITGLSLPGATVLSLAYAWFLGFWRGLVMVSFASTSGATVAFLLSRFLLRDWVRERFGERARQFNEALEKEGPYYLFTLRLIPAAPFFVINAVMGLTPIRVRDFWWISQLGMLPASIVYVYAGSRVPSLQRLSDEGLRAALSGSQIFQIFLALVLLGITPLVLRWALRRGHHESSSETRG